MWNWNEPVGLIAPGRLLGPKVAGDRRNFIQCLGQPRQVAPAVLSQFQPAGKATEQGDSQPFLQHFHVMADRRGRDLQLLRSTRETAVPAGGLEGAHGTQRRKMPAITWVPVQDRFQPRGSFGKTAPLTSTFKEGRRFHPKSINAIGMVGRASSVWAVTNPAISL